MPNFWAQAKDGGAAVVGFVYSCLAKQLDLPPRQEYSGIPRRSS